MPTTFDSPLSVLPLSLIFQERLYSGRANGQLYYRCIFIWFNNDERLTYIKRSVLTGSGREIFSLSTSTISSSLASAIRLGIDLMDADWWQSAMDVDFLPFRYPLVF